MSKARAPAHEVAGQVKLWGWSGQDGGSGPLAARQPLELRAFLRLLEHSCLQEFLARDPCFQVSDKYLLAMVLVYFRRANLKLSEYTCSNLFLALYLANDMEEDLEEAKCMIFPWALGEGWHNQVADFLRQRDRLWARMGFRALVSRRHCEKVMAMEPSHWAWTRERCNHHGGAHRSYSKAGIALPGGPGFSPPHCSLCGSPPLHSHYSHQPCPLPVLPESPAPNPEGYGSPSQACLSGAEDPWAGGFLMVLPSRLLLEPGTYTLHSELRAGAGGGLGRLGDRCEADRTRGRAGTTGLGACPSSASS
ncbi:speedy protein C isoform X2 [Myotis daubentonii]|nr:speedy protein C isoform X2 [Myotis daubentonii]XP_059566139.1 speedy protein C isoform X2 [Myotis daubentonii]